MPVHVIRRARHHLALSSRIGVAAPREVWIGFSFYACSTSFDSEVSPATMIYPDDLAVRAPAVAFPASRLAALLNQLNPAWTRGTVVPSAIVRGTRNCDSAPTSTTDRPPVLVGTRCKVSPAATVNPDTPTVKAPAVALLAG